MQESWLLELTVGGWTKGWRILNCGSTSSRPCIARSTNVHEALYCAFPSKLDWLWEVLWASRAELLLIFICRRGTELAAHVNCCRPAFCPGVLQLFVRMKLETDPLFLSGGHWLLQTIQLLIASLQQGPQVRNGRVLVYSFIVLLLMLQNFHQLLTPLLLFRLFCILYFRVVLHLEDPIVVSLDLIVFSLDRASVGSSWSSSNRDMI